MVWIAQTPEEFAARVDVAMSGHALGWFRPVQLTQGVVCIVTHGLILLLVARTRELQKRNFLLLCAVSTSDLAFGSYLLWGVGVLSYAQQTSIPYGRDGCQVFAWWTVFTMLLSLLTYALIAYERYRAICTPLAPLGSRHVKLLYGGCVCLALIAATLAFVAGLGGAAAQPSGLYCNLDFRQLGNCLLTLVSILLSLGLLACYYIATIRHLRAFARAHNAQGTLFSRQLQNEENEEIERAETLAAARDEQLAWARRAMATVVKLAGLTGGYIACWTPALVMLLLQVSGAPAAAMPAVDIVAALFASLSISSKAMLHFAFFPPLRAAAQALFAPCRASAGGATRTLQRADPAL